MKTSADIPPNIVSFFSAEILAVYSNQPDKYTVETDYFSGEVQKSGDKSIFSVRFGFRTRKDGDLAVAVFMPDLKNCSPDERKKWNGFALGVCRR